MSVIRNLLVLSLISYGVFLLVTYNRAVNSPTIVGRSTLVNDPFAKDVPHPFRYTIPQDITLHPPVKDDEPLENDDFLEEKQKNIEPESVEKIQGTLKAIIEEEQQDDEDSLYDKNSLQIDDENFVNETRKQMNPLYLLGAYPKLNSSYVHARYGEPKNGIFADVDYCDRADAYNLKYQENMFKEKHFFSNHPIEHVSGSLMSKLGTLSKGILDENLPEDTKAKRRYHIPININNFFVTPSNFYHYYEIGKHAACATQMFNHIPGQFRFVSKDAFLDRVEAYSERYKGQPQCFNKNEFAPESFRLFIKEECVAFFQMMHSKEYQESLKIQPIQHIVKVSHGSHQSAGVFLLDKEEEKNLNGTYKRGKLCGKEESPLIVQKYISNPLLLDKNNKFDFRVYLLIASTNPVIAYYHDGFLRVSLNSYDKTSTEKATHITNTHLAIERMIEAQQANHSKINNMTEQEIQDYIWWSFDRFQNYLLESGKITDPNWLDNYLRPTFKKALIHLVRMAKDVLWQQSNVYELYGVDFMLDEDMNLWFIETNSSPQLMGFTKDKNLLYLSVVMGTFDIQYAYYKSRMQRVAKVIKDMQKEMHKKDNVNIEKWQKKYQEAAKNKLDSKYKISEKNKFVPIIDENLPEEEVYFGLLSEECASF